MAIPLGSRFGSRDYYMSTSAGIQAPGTLLPSGEPGYHVYVKVNDTTGEYFAYDPQSGPWTDEEEESSDEFSIVMTEVTMDMSNADIRVQVQKDVSDFLDDPSDKGKRNPEAMAAPRDYPIPEF